MLRRVRDDAILSVMRKGGFVYILTNREDGPLYVGVTSNLAQRIHQHKQGQADSFTKKYGLKRLVWFGAFDEIEEAIAYEKRMKRWRRGWKVRLIEDLNPRWSDLFDEIRE